jgi:nucleoside-diphosphate-sugar epimerase
MGTVLITGGAGFLGVGVAERLLARDPGASVLLTDLAEHPRIARLGGRARFVKADLADPAASRGLVGPDVYTVFHFASLVSGGAERDFAAGMAANVHATMHLLEACRSAGSRPRLVFPSSIATFGGSDLPPVVDDRTAQHPQNSYGVAKLLGEALINDYTRKGFLSGRSIRLPAVVVRDEPNSAASGYASGLIREPLAGRDYVCPVTPETRLPIVSLQRCVELLIQLGDLPDGALGDWTAVNGPGISPSAGEIAEAVLRSGRARGAIRFAPDPAVMAIVAAWPKQWVADRAAALGLRADASIEAIIAGHRPE